MGRQIPTWFPDVHFVAHNMGADELESATSVEAMANRSEVIALNVKV